MKFKKILPIMSFAFCILIFFSGIANADKPLKSALDLNVDQAAKVAAIQKEARDAFRKPRGELHRKQRELRRAKTANDSVLISELEKEILPMQGILRQIHEEEEKKIRAVLTPEQIIKYEQWLKERDAMAGSSRDVKEY